MRKGYKIILMLFVLALSAATSHAQIDSVAIKAKATADKVSKRMLAKLSRKYRAKNKALTKNNESTLDKMEKNEKKILDKMKGMDSATAVKAYQKIKDKYAHMRSQLQKPATTITQYLPGLDSMQTAFKFLDGKGAQIPGIPADKVAAIKALNTQFASIQSSLEHTASIKDFLKDRKQVLMDQFGKMGVGTELQSINKEVYYYQAQVNEYKAMLNDPDKMQEKIMGLLRGSNMFKDFMAKNGQLAQIFGMGGGTSGPGVPVPGLQTRAAVQGSSALAMPSAGGANPTQMVQQGAQAAQAEMDKLRDKINQLGGGGAGDLTMPEFKPNKQKTKSFWKRVELGINIQSQKPNALLPTTSDIAFTMGYKLSDKSTIGVGASYKLGWGKDISHIQLSSQGLSLRSFVDMKIKGTWWITGGYEENYQQEFKKIEDLKNIAAWQKSGLIGMTKKYKIGKKTGNVQLLWDFLSYGQVPQTQPLKFRLGYTL